MDVVTAVPPITAVKGNERKSVTESLPAGGSFCSRGWMNENKQNRDDAPAGREQPLHEGDHRAWAWGNAGCHSQLVQGELHWFLPLNLIHTQRTGIQHKPTTRGFCVTLHLGYLIYQINAAFAAGFAPSLGVFPNIGK